MRKNLEDFDFEEQALAAKPESNFAAVDLPAVEGAALNPAPTPEGDLAPDDFYFEGPYMVFTAAYHLKRGYCCNSDCRHCPYR